MSKPIYFIDGIYDKCEPSVEDRATIANIESRHVDAVIGEWNNYFSLSSFEVTEALDTFRKNLKKRKRA